jgi:hypothetical protein
MTEKKHIFLMYVPVLAVLPLALIMLVFVLTAIIFQKLMNMRLVFIKSGFRMLFY